MEKIKNVVFDMGGVLVDIDRDASVRAFTEIGYADAGKLLDPYTQTGIFLQLEEGKIEPQQLYEYIWQQVGHRIDPRAIDGALEKFIVGLPVYKLDMLRELRKKYRVYLLSNTNAILFPYIARTLFTQRGLTVDDYFDHKFLSYEMRLVKPNKEIFLKMIEMSGVRPEETLFVDDAKANVEAGESVGLRTYLASPNEDFRPLFDQYQPIA